ncbi:MAG TPA: LysR family transcriptional regulator [Polyangiales bacterium]|nr:LysR family transcriptional regulator [Polyangiales bacterium]
MIDWSDLQVFLALARHGTLSAAARALGVTQPTMGRRIAAFEQRLGAKLFERSPRGWALSEVGLGVLQHAEHMQAHALSAESLATGRDAGVVGTVRVTASEWMICSVLAPALPAHLARHPGLCLELIADTRHLSLVKREADIALRPSRFTHKEIVQREVGVIEFGLYASETYLARHGVPDFARGCAGHTLITATDDMNNLADYAWLPPLAANARVAVRTNGREPMAKLAAAGIGIVVLPRYMGDANSVLRRLETPLPGPRRQLWLGVHRSARATPRIRVALSFLAESLQHDRSALCPSCA